MRRRTFLTSTLAAAGAAVTAAGQEASAPLTEGAFAGIPIRFSVPPGWFSGTYGEQLDQIAALGFQAFEDLNPKTDPAELRAMMDTRGLKLSCILGAGAIAPGHMLDPAQHDQVEAQFRDRVAMAKTLGVKCLIGLTGNTLPDVPFGEQTAHAVACLKRLAPIAEANGVIIVMEALNVLVNHAGYHLTTTAQTMALLEAVGSPHVKMCYDIYHQQITEGNLIRNITENIDRIGHLHVGDNPGRQEPGTGEINYRNVFKAIYDKGYATGRYDGFVTFECGNSKDTSRALRRIRACVDWA